MDKVATMAVGRGAGVGKLNFPNTSVTLPLVQYTRLLCLLTPPPVPQIQGKRQSLLITKCL